MNKDKDIVEEGLWDHYRELPNPLWYHWLWYEWKEKNGKETEG